MVRLNRPDHTKAINLARRLSVQNEVDLLQEPYYGVFAVPDAFCREMAPFKT